MRRIMGKVLEFKKPTSSYRACVDCEFHVKSNTSTLFNTCGETSRYIEDERSKGRCGPEGLLWRKKAEPLSFFQWLKLKLFG